MKRRNVEGRRRSFILRECCGRGAGGGFAKSPRQSIGGACPRNHANCRRDRSESRLRWVFSTFSGGHALKCHRIGNGKMSVEGLEPAQSAMGKRVGVARMETGDGGAVVMYHVQARTEPTDMGSLGTWGTLINLRTLGYSWCAVQFPHAAVSFAASSIDGRR